MKWHLWFQVGSMSVSFGAESQFQSLEKPLFDRIFSVTPFLSAISVKYKRKQSNFGS